MSENPTTKLINTESQALLEKQICKNITDLGFAVYAIPAAVQSYHGLVHLQKLLSEYFDNTRLLATTIKENVSI